MKKLIFPFFNKNRHSFLTKKRWFRLIISIYTLVLIFGIPIISIKWTDYIYEKCFNYASIVDEQMGEKYDNLIDTTCGFENKRDIELGEGWIIPLGWRTIGTFVIIHYLIQLIFFKRFIDYIILGGKKE